MAYLSQLLAFWACALLAPSWSSAASTDLTITDERLASGIAAAPLPQGLSAFAQQTGLQLIYVSQLAEGRRSQAVSAGLSPAIALAQMLAGTGLDFEFINSRTVKIFAVPAPLFSGHDHLTHPAAHAPAEISILEEITVTATKREEFLSDVPISATVFSGDAMLEAGITNIAELASATPGVEYDFNAQWGGGVLTNIAIRGIDSRVGASTTGIYVDDAPIQARNGNFGNPYPATFDLARVEVLRGPQGTLFGAGAEGGAIRFVTNAPSTTDFDAISRAELSVTKYGGMSYEIGAAAGGPLIDDYVGARLAVWYRDDGGYVDRVNPFTNALLDKNANGSRTEAIRLNLAVEPFETLRITPLLTYQSLRIGDSSSFYEYLSDPSAGVFRNGKLLSQPFKDSFALASIKFEYGLSASKLTAVSSYFDRTVAATIDTTNEAGAVFYGGFGNPLGPAYPASYADADPSATSLHQIVLSQEIRLASDDPAAPIRWTAGLFYSRARQDELLYTYPIATPTNLGVYENDDYTDTLISGFGNIELAIAPGWRTRLGLRVDDARSETSAYAGGFAVSGELPYSHGLKEEKPITPQFDVEYQGAEHGLYYATIAKGYRIGGINTGLPAQCGMSAVPPSYAADSLWNYEIGSKGRPFGDRLQIAASAYYLRWHDIQDHEVPECGFDYVANAGNATGKGIDLSLDAALTDRMTLGLALESVDVRFDQTVVIAGKVIAARGAVVGGFPHIPAPWNGTAYLRYQRPIGTGAVAYVRLEDIVHSHNPGPFTDQEPNSISDSPFIAVDPATNQLNMQLGLTWSHWDARIFVNNALNSLPVLQQNADSSSSSLIYAYSLRPRTIGVTTARRF